MDGWTSIRGPRGPKKSSSEKSFCSLIKMIIIGQFNVHMLMHINDKLIPDMIMWKDKSLKKFKMVIGWN